ncbi:VOC family protein [Mucilaginibacter hurinus]|uniref:Bleomycin resistance protein n=1 Tax=Mucilaginibacter hurinus TaxID=2201324 RepID=A0A367GMF6_9SPHI|nr:VOC family protein [Mucilaginibacter hurinus]RCH54500.1 VOC family protein [Mucilaginibacter hurinus]
MLQQAIPILASLNAAETIAFYTQKLGFTFHNNWDGYLIFSRDEIIIHLWPTTDPSVPKATGCYVFVTGIDALHDEYKAHNLIHPHGGIENKPWGKRQFSVLDNNGNIINFGQDI